MDGSVPSGIEPFELILVGQQGPVFVTDRDEDETQLQVAAAEHNARLASVPWLRYEVRRYHRVARRQPVFSD